MTKHLLEITTHYEQLDLMARLLGVDLKSAFVEAGVPTSTYYRAKHGAELRASTATRIAAVIRNDIRGKHGPAQTVSA